MKIFVEVMILLWLFKSSHQGCDYIRNDGKHRFVCTDQDDSSVYNLENQITNAIYKTLYNGEKYDGKIEKSRIMVLPKTFIGPRYNLQNVDVRGIGIEKISPGAFANLYDVRKIYLQSNNITAISSGVFSGISTLEEIYLDHNKIDQIESGAFDDLKSLTLLDLGYNNLNTLPWNLFDSFSKIKSLDISNNKISELDKSLLIRCGNLDILFLGFNNITNLDSKVFESLTNLKQLDISHNPIQTFGEDFFTKQTQLRVLNIGALKNDVVLSFARASINESLVDLHLSENNLKSLNRSFIGKYKNLKLLNISCNDISELEADVFSDLKKLSILDLRNNQLTKLPHGIFSNLLQLERLDISSNNIMELPYGILDPLQDLVFLNISSNVIETIRQYCFHSLKKLNELLLDYNKLKQLDGSELISNMKSLKKISLDGNYWLCDDLVKLINILEKERVHVVYGVTSHTHNINKIKCKETIALEDSYDKKVTEAAEYEIDYYKQRPMGSVNNPQKYVNYEPRNEYVGNIPAILNAIIVLLVLLVVIIIGAAIVLTYVYYRKSQVNYRSSFNNKNDQSEIMLIN